MRVLFLTHSFNSLTQRLYGELVADGHDVAIEFDVNDRVTEEAVALAQPDVVIAPFLKRAIPASVWQRHRCLVVHPGIIGDRGPCALDWAILEGERDWGVTVIEANGEMDAGDIWASAAFPMREAAKGSLYRNEVTEAAVIAVRHALERIGAGERPEPLESRSDVRGRLRPPCRQADRAIDWLRDDTRTVLRKIRSADGFPGVHDVVRGVPCHLYDAHAERMLRGAAGELIAQRDGAICRATVDGAVWITHAKRLAANGDAAIKLPAANALSDVVADVERAPLAPDVPVDHDTWRPIVYEERGGIGYLHFPFYNGAMGTAHCAALADARAREGAADARARADGRPRLLVEWHPPQPDRGRGQSRRRVVAKYQRDERRRPRDHPRRSPAHDRSRCGQCRRRRRVPRARRRSRLRARGRDPQSALQGHGEPLRLRVLDVPAAATHPCGASRGDHASPAADRCARGSGARACRCAFRRDGRSVSRGDRRARERARGGAGFRRPSCLEERAPARRRAHEAARRLSRRGARADAAQLLRLRLELPRRTLQLRAEAAAVANAAAPCHASPGPPRRGHWTRAVAVMQTPERSDGRARGRLTHVNTHTRASCEGSAGRDEKRARVPRARLKAERGFKEKTWRIDRTKERAVAHGDGSSPGS